MSFSRGKCILGKISWGFIFASFFIVKVEFRSCSKAFEQHLYSQFRLYKFYLDVLSMRLWMVKNLQWNGAINDWNHEKNVSLNKQLKQRVFHLFRKTWLCNKRIPTVYCGFLHRGSGKNNFLKNRIEYFSFRTKDEIR